MTSCRMYRRFSFSAIQKRRTSQSHPDRFHMAHEQSLGCGYQANLLKTGFFELFDESINILNAYSLIYIRE